MCVGVHVGGAAVREAGEVGVTAPLHADSVTAIHNNQKVALVNRPDMA